MLTPEQSSYSEQVQCSLFTAFPPTAGERQALDCTSVSSTWRVVITVSQAWPLLLAGVLLVRRPRPLQPE
jgi:hypothetical protein